MKTEHIDRIIEANPNLVNSREVLDSMQEGTYCIHRSWGFGKISGFSEDRYLLLSVEDKIKFQKVYESYAKVMESRGLYSEEADFVRLWVGFKDRELGQSMLAQAEAKKPAAERGKSQLAQTITMGIVAGNMVKSQQLRELKELNESVDEIAEDVEDASGGFEM